MLVGDARAAATDWVTRHGSRLPGFRGAYLTGSTLTLPPGAEVPVGSDTDVMVVLDTLPEGHKPGKFLHRGALLEVSYLPHARLADPEAVLGSYHLAGAFRTDVVPGGTLLADPYGELARLRATVGRAFADPRWVRRRRAEARGNVERALTGLDTTAPWPRLVTSWLFPTGVTTHVVLVAGLRNPTVRLRYLAVRDLLLSHGLGDAYDGLLRLLGCQDLTARRAEEHLHALARTFDATAPVARTPFPFSSDLTPAARPIAIDGSLRLIRAGRQREVMFWIAATFARCHMVLDADAPGLGRELAPAFDAALADLGIASAADLAARARAVLAHLPAVEEAAERVQAATLAGKAGAAAG
ncbi:hypothetical protein [Streptomyces avicenniae]|uniref:hypothetical protein n=1 Tax=Streptomyces avicenniae TaxID=500153 RepID=UPI00069C8373|nr:hypothetical protein [Streptomyces avicenniae]